ncbi:MAG: hypothetical protein M1816_002819 [Peltula sp. TS41687]|nr:MAG: hypothetical protein M1816_002819 [Peltula sp. TS41687]
MVTSITIQKITYLLGVCLFSISFLVFLNASVSFVITDRIGIQRGVGDLVGTLGFVDELIALIACPVWGSLSDRIGVRAVCVIGYVVVGTALFLFVQAKNVYPQLLLVRILFSVGGAATATMVTAILPSITIATKAAQTPSSPVRRPSAGDQHDSQTSTSPSLSSELTITPARLARRRSPALPLPAIELPDDSASRSNSSSPSRLAGIVGLFTGCGALLALVVFLPLPTKFANRNGVSAGQALVYSYYVVGSIALLIAAFCFVGLSGLTDQKPDSRKGRNGTGNGVDYHQASHDTATHGEPSSADVRVQNGSSGWKSLLDAVVLGFQDVDIGLGYLGGFVARASSVGISLFIPLYINAYFISSGLCKGDPSHTNPDKPMKEQCKQAYILSAELTGTSQLVALIFAPLFGYISDHLKSNIPLITASLTGLAGYISFALVPPIPHHTTHPQPGIPIFIIASLLGISQIGCIVCSLGLLGHGIIRDHQTQHAEESPAIFSSPSPPLQRQDRGDEEEEVEEGEVETTTLLHRRHHHRHQDLNPNNSLLASKGSIAGIYSLTGGAGILLLTKLGGYLFDHVSPSAPFWMLAGFNAVLFCVAVGLSLFGVGSSSGLAH